MALVQWSTRFSTLAVPIDITNDSARNTFTVGIYAGAPIDFYDAITSGNQIFGPIQQSLPVDDLTTFVSKHDSDGNFVWAFQLVDAAGVRGNAIIESAGKLYLIGTYEDDLDVYDALSSMTPVMVLPHNSTDSTPDGFLACYDSDTGAFEWITAINSESGQQRTDPQGVTVQGSQIYVTGTFRNDTNFYGVLTETPSPFTLGTPVLTLNVGSTAINRTRVFLVCYTEDGIYTSPDWTTKVEGEAVTVQASPLIEFTFDINRPTVCANSTGVFVAGQQPIEDVSPIVPGLAVNFFDSDTSLALALDTNVPISTFLARYSSSGELVWATFIDDNYDLEVNDDGAIKIACNSTNVYLVDLFENTVDFYDPVLSPPELGPSVLTLDNQDSNARNIYVACYTNSGSLDWVVPVSSASIFSSDIFVVSDQICIVGTSETDISIYNSVTTTPSPAELSSVITLSGNGDTDGFVVSYDHDGLFRWTSILSGTGADSGLGLSIQSDYLTVTGAYETPNIRFYDHASLFYPTIDLGDPIITQDFVGSNNGYLVQYRLVSPSTPPCFTEDAIFQLESGDTRKMAELRPGDRIVCRDGSRTVAKVYKMPTFKPERLIRFTPGSLGENVPSKTLTLTYMHWIIHPDGSEDRCQLAVNHKDIIESVEPVKYIYHVQIDQPGDISYAQVNGGIWADVWCNDNWHVQNPELAKIHNIHK